MELLTFSPPVIAHRGASAYAPENTIIAFTKAVQLGARWVEFDVQLSSGGEVLVFHDAALARTTNGRGELKNYSCEYLQSLDAGMWFHPFFSQERIPTLKQALTFLIDKGISANIELKPEQGNEIALVKAVLNAAQLIQKKSIQLLYSSFCLKTMQYLHQADHNVPLGLLMDSLLPNWTNLARNLNVSAININEKILTPALSQQVKSLKKVLACYTVNDPQRAKTCYALGVDALFTDVPDLILAAI